MTFTAEEKLREVRREVKMRKLVYARRDMMPPHEAKYKIDIMQEIAEDYEKLAQKERLL
jgi:hypothetical protein